MNTSFNDGNRKYSPVKKLPELEVSKKVIHKLIDVKSSSFYRNKPANIHPIFDGKTLFIASQYGRVFATNIDGVVLWDIQTKHQIIGGLSYDSVTKTLIFSTKAGLVVALDGKTGSLMWQRQLAGSIISPAAISYRENRVVLSSNNGILYGLNRKNGSPIWSYTTPTPNISVRGTAAPIIKKDVAVFAAADGRVYLLNSSDGILIWSKQIGTVDRINRNTTNINKRVDYVKDIDSTPVFDGNYMYTATQGGQLTAFDLSTKKVAFSHQAKVIKQPLIIKNLLVVVTNDGLVQAYDKKTGRLLWKNSQLQYRALTNPEFMSRHIIIGDKKGYLYVLNSVTGKIVSREKTSGQLKHLTVSAGRLIVHSNSNDISLWR